MKYKSGFSKINFIIPLIPAVLILIIHLISGESLQKAINPIVALLTLLTLLFIVLFYTTYYKIENEVLIVSMFFYKTKIKISEIRTIKYSNSIIKTNFYKPGFHHKGIEIMYHKYEDIYISPENRDQIIAKLLEINTNIEIKK